MNQTTKPKLLITVRTSFYRPLAQGAQIYIALSEDGSTMNLFIKDYVPTDFFVNSYAFWSTMEMWADMSFYYDLYFTFKKVTE